jgi:hypothetical protein
MEKTQKLMSIAIAVLALDGCRGASTNQAAAPNPSSSPTPSAVGSTHYHHYGGSHLGSFAAGAAVGAAVGGNRGYSQRPGYPQSGYGNTATVDRTLGGNRSRGIDASNGVRTGGTSYGSRSGFFGRFFGRGGGFGGFGARGFGG